MKNGRITHIDLSGQWNGMNKHLVTFADGQSFTFFSKGDFKAAIGDEIKYTISNEEMRNAKLVRDNFQNKSFTPSNNTSTPKADVQTSIIKQTCIKASSELHAGRGQSDVQSVLEDAQIMFNWVTQ
jgi:hypothetical protein